MRYWFHSGFRVAVFFVIAQIQVSLSSSSAEFKGLYLRETLMFSFLDIIIIDCLLYVREGLRMGFNVKNKILVGGGKEEIRVGVKKIMYGFKIMFGGFIGLFI
jgi:hypothetical protein